MKLDDAELREIAAHTYSFKGKRNLIKGYDALLIWQYVRLNKRYQKEFLSLQQEKYNDDEYELASEHFCRRWAISSPRDFLDPRLPPQFYLDRRVVKVFSNKRVLKNWIDWFDEERDDHLVLVVNKKSDRRLILQEIEELLRTEKTDASLQRFRLKGSSIGHLADTFLCFYLKVELGLPNNEVKKKLRSLQVGGDLQDHQIPKKITAFEKISHQSPWCFFVAPS